MSRGKVFYRTVVGGRESVACVKGDILFLEDSWVRVKPEEEATVKVLVPPGNIVTVEYLESEEREDNDG